MPLASFNSARQCLILTGLLCLASLHCSAGATFHIETCWYCMLLEVGVLFRGLWESEMVLSHLKKNRLKRTLLANVSYSGEGLALLKSEAVSYNAQLNFLLWSPWADGSCLGQRFDQQRKNWGFQNWIFLLPYPIRLIPYANISLSVTPLWQHFRILQESF